MSLFKNKRKISQLRIRYRWLNRPPIIIMGKFGCRIVKQIGDGWVVISLDREKQGSDLENKERE